MLPKPAAALAALLALAVNTGAPAATLSSQGLLAADNPNDVALIEFETSATASLDAQTWSFGGGVNGAGQAIAAGGFDTYLSLFAGWGGAATFLASNDDGLCPPGTAAPSCADSTLHVGALPAGRYTVAISQPANYVTVGPTTAGSTLGVTSITLTNLGATDRTIFVFAPVLAGGQVCGSTNVIGGSTPRFYVRVPASQTVHLTYPTPLVYPGVGRQSCVAFGGAQSVDISVNGFLN